MTRQTQWPLVVLIALFVLLGVIYSLVTPVFEASDELSHYPVVREIAEGRGLPVVHPGEEEPWRQEGTQPPLYYALSAALTFWLDTSDMEEVLWRNPHATIGVPLAYGNKNMIIHTDKERFPWHGSVLAVYLIRFLSVLLGASTVFLTWRLGHELGPGCPEVALAAAALVAFNPMFLFVTGSVNNDNLAVLLGTLTVWLLATVLRHGVTGQRLVILGLLLGLGAITKLSLLGLLPLAAVTLAYVAWQQRALLSPLIRWWLTLLGMVLVIAGWWYVRNWQLYGDPLALNVHLDAVGRRAFVPDWRKLLGEWEGFRISYWGLFGGVNVLAPGAMYKAFDLLLLFGLLGLPLAVWRLWRDQQRDSLTGLALLAAWVITVLVSLTHWTRLTPASQGRLMFPAIAAISILLASGLLALVPRRWRSLTAGVLSLGMATWAALLPFVVIVPAYARPSMLNQADVPPELPRINVTHAGVLRLLAADVETHTVRVGEPVRFTLYWQAVAETSTDYSVFVHLLGSNGEVVGSIGTYPGQGAWPTSQLRLGAVLRDVYQVPTEHTATAPSLVDIDVGLYLYRKGGEVGEAALDEEGQPTSGVIGQVRLVRAEPPEYLSQYAVDFELGGQVALRGYDVSQHSVPAGEAVTVTLYWQGLSLMEENYTAFVHLVDAEENLVAQHDKQLLAGDWPTSAWQPGETVPDTYTLEIPDQTAVGTYQLRVGLYLLRDGRRLPVSGPPGRIVSDSIILDEITVTAPEAQARVRER